MIDPKQGLSSFSVADADASEAFYRDVLGVPYERNDDGIMFLSVGGGTVMVYPKGDGHTAATFTVLHFAVDDLDATIDELTGKGQMMLQYPNTDEKGIATDLGPRMAWIEDPSGNVIGFAEGGLR